MATGFGESGPILARYIAYYLVRRKAQRNVPLFAAAFVKLSRPSLMFAV